MTELDLTEEYETYISTHTLTWSVTGVSSVASSLSAISTHTLTWSVTVCTNGNGKTAYSFQLTLVLSISLDTFYSNKNYAARKI